MSDDNNEAKGIPYEEMKGWPGTPETQRMIRASKFIIQEGAPLDDDTYWDDPELAQDAQMLCLATAAHRSPSRRTHFTPSRPEATSRTSGT